MAVKTNKLKKALYVLLGLLVLIVVAATGVGAYVFINATRPVNYNLGVSSLDANSTSRAWKNFKEARTANQRAFLELSREEINSYIHQRYFYKTNADELAVYAHTNGAVVERAGLKLTLSNVTWYSWVNQGWTNRTWNRPWTWFWSHRRYVWQEEVALRNNQTNWSVQPVELRMGNLKIPKRLWGYMKNHFGPQDPRSAELYEDVCTNIAYVSLVTKTNDPSRLPRLKLFNYLPETRP